MKKKLSLMVALVMIFSVFGSFAYAAPSKTLGEVLALVKVEKIEPGRDLALDLFNNYLTEEKIAELSEKVSHYNELRNGLVADGITKAQVRDLVNIVEGLNSSDLGRIPELKAEAMEILGSDIVGRVLEAKGNTENIDFTYDLINRIISKTEVVKYDTYTKKFTVNFSGYKLDANLKGYLTEVFPNTFPEESINNDLNTAATVIAFILNEDSDFDEYKNDLRALLTGYPFYKEVSSQPGGGNTGGGGGGGTGGSTSGPTTETPKVKDGEVKVELGKDAVEVKEGSEGQAVVSVKSESIKAAIASLLEVIKANPTAKPVMVIALDDVRTTAMEVALSQETMKELAKNNIELIIESRALTYEVSVDLLNSVLENAPANSQIEFKSADVDVDVAKSLFSDVNVPALSKVIEFSIVIKDAAGNVVRTVSNFGSKIKVGIELEAGYGNSDLLGAFYINESNNRLEFVGGKVRGNKIFMAVDHYSKFAVAEYVKTFKDISAHWSKDYVESMVAKHVVDGFEDNTYKPEDKLTRAQFAKLLVETLELEIASFKGEFVDVNNAHWAKDYIATAKSAGIIGGYEDGTFKPDQTVTRAEMAAMISKALELNSSSQAGLSQFTDRSDIPAWAVDHMAQVVAEKLLVGSNGVLNPNGNVTRAEAATIIYRVYNR